MRRLSLSQRIVAGLVAGAALGVVSKLAWAAPLNAALVAIEPVGTAFIRLATMIVVPLVIGSLFTGVASLGDIRRLGAIGGRTFAYFVITTFLAGVSPSMHAFWSEQDPQRRQAEMVNFMKNVALIGGALLAAAEPEPWPYSPAARSAAA